MQLYIIDGSTVCVLLEYETISCDVLAILGYIQFNEDGTLRVAGKVDDLDLPVSEAHPGSNQKWTYDGMVITFQETEPGVGEGFEGCTTDQVGVYFVRWAGEDLDRLKFEPIEDECGARYGGMMWGNWASVSP